jgi:two-component system phosphate regulon sensor histidine kinase PhoR
MRPILTILSLLGLLWVGGLLALTLHRARSRLGLAPLAIYLGGLVAILQMPGLGLLNVEIIGIQFRLASHVILPTILLGLLVVYVVDGTIQARPILEAIILVALLLGILQIYAPIFHALSGEPSLSSLQEVYPLRLLAASTFTLVVDVILLVILYQAISNLRRHFPSIFAGELALWGTLSVDALLFTSINFAGTPQWGQALWSDWAAKSLAALAFSPLVYSYIKLIAPTLPDTAATTPRPTLDLFNTQVELEARMRLQYGLLYTLSQINQFIMKATHAQSLLEQACTWLAAGRDLQLVWVGLRQEGNPNLALAAKAGSRARSINLTGWLDTASATDAPTWLQAFKQGRAVVEPDLSEPGHPSAWRTSIWQAGIRALAAFPMRYHQKTIGVLCLMSTHLEAFNNPQEVHLFQELADDLAFALISLEARQRQTLLESSAENLRDGMLIMSRRGVILYVNPAMADMLGYSVGEMLNQNILNFISREQTGQFAPELISRLCSEGKFTADLEFTNRQGRMICISVRAILSLDERTGVEHIVLSGHEITERRAYEKRLLTLNRLTNDIVQIHDIQTLWQTIVQVCQELFIADAVAIFLCGTNSEDANLVYSQNLPGNNSQRLPNLRTLARGEILAIDGTINSLIDPDFRESMNALGFHSILAIPMLFQEKMLGVTVMYYKNTRSFSDDEKQFGRTVTQTLAIALQNASLYQSEHNQRQLAEALVQAGITLNSSLDLNEVLNQILEQTIQVVACQSVNLMLVEGESVRVVRHLDHRDPMEIKRAVTGLEMPLSLPTLQQMLETGQPLLIANTSQSALWKDIGQTSWIRSYAAAPLQVRGQVIGFLNINSDQPDFFTEETTHSLVAFATTASTAIQNARLYRDLQAHNVELEERVQGRTAELRAAKDKIERILLSVPDAVFVLDDSHHVIQANPAGEYLFVMASEEKIELFSKDFLEKLSNGNIPAEKGILEIGGNAYQALASPLPGTDESQELVVVFRDVTRFQELDRMKTQFVSDVSHELRTPLTNQTIYLDLLKNTEDLTRRQKYLDILERETSRLTDLIEDLLMISRLEADRVQIKLEPVDLNTLMQDLVYDRLSLAQKRRLELTFQPGTDLPPLLTDPRLLIQVISNLLTNALNYTQAGGAIQLRTSMQGTETTCWQTVTIEDSGYGIRPEEMQRIFERFFRGSASKLSDAPGTGLGLAISKEIMQRMGGKITLTSEPAQGSSFTVWVKAVL